MPANLPTVRFRYFDDELEISYIGLAQVNPAEGMATVLRVFDEYSGDEVFPYAEIKSSDFPHTPSLRFAWKLRVAFADALETAAIEAYSYPAVLPIELPCDEKERKETDLNAAFK